MHLVKAEHASPVPRAFSQGGVDWASCLPEDSLARIWRPAKSAMTSGRARTKDWRLRVEPQRAPWIEPLMGWTASDDVAHQIELSFPTLEAAIRHVERLGISCLVQLPPGEAGKRSRPAMVATSCDASRQNADADQPRQAA